MIQERCHYYIFHLKKKTSFTFNQLLTNSLGFVTLILSRVKMVNIRNFVYLFLKLDNYFGTLKIVLRIKVENYFKTK